MILPSALLSRGGMYLTCRGLLMLPSVCCEFRPFYGWSDPEFFDERFLESTNCRSRLLLLSDRFR